MHPIQPGLLRSSFSQPDGYRELPDLTTATLDPPGALERADTRALLRAYPSPPMSGSPPPSQKAPPDAGDLTQRQIGHLPPTPYHDALRGSSTRPSSDPRASQGQFPMHETYARLSHHEPTERMAYSYQQQHPREGPPRPLSFPSQGLPSLTQSQPFAPTTGAASHLGYVMANRPHAPESQSFATSPKSQRKVKGHVASACVPCKRAHLR